jgi:hypothetical protein
MCYMPVDYNSKVMILIKIQSAIVVLVSKYHMRFTCQIKYSGMVPVLEARKRFQHKYYYVTVPNKSYE